MGCSQVQHESFAAGVTGFVAQQARPGRPSAGGLPTQSPSIPGWPTPGPQSIASAVRIPGWEPSRPSTGGSRCGDRQPGCSCKRPEAEVAPPLTPNGAHNSSPPSFEGCDSGDPVNSTDDDGLPDEYQWKVMVRHHGETTARRMACLYWWGFAPGNAMGAARLGRRCGVGVMQPSGGPGTRCWRSGRGGSSGVLVGGESPSSRRGVRRT